MNRSVVSMKKSNAFDALVYALLPLPFFGTPWLNILFFPFGIHRIDLLRKAVIYSITLLIALFLSLKVVSFWKRKELQKILLFTLSLPTVFGLFYLLAILLQEHPAKLLLDAATGGCSIVSCCCALLIVIAERKAENLFRMGRIYAMVTSPVLLYYAVRFYLPGAGYGTNNLGVLSYMPLAYCCLTICIFLLLDAFLFQYSNGKPGKTAWIDLALLTLYAVCITLSGTRGTILCLLFFALLSPLFFFQKKQSFLVSAVVFCSVFLFSTVLMPLSEYNRVAAVIDETNSLSGEFTKPADSTTPVNPATPVNPTTPVEPAEFPLPTNTRSRLSNENIDAVAQIVLKADPSIRDNPLNHIVEVAYGVAPALLEKGELSQLEYDRLSDMAYYLNSTSLGGRLFLWTCALHEIQAAPLTGHGVMYFQDKYGTYPHNYFLEIATDFGLLAMFAVLALGLYTFWFLLKRSKDNELLKAWLLYIFISLPRYMIGTSMYAPEAFIQMGFCVVLLAAIWKTSVLPSEEKV